MGGLGDCLIAGAALQKLGTPVKFITNSLLEPVFRYHPTIKFVYDGADPFEFKWVSQIKDKNLYGLHTMQRFSSQIGLYLDPMDVLNIYNVDKKPMRSNGLKIVVNECSAEGERRHIPPKYMDMIDEIVDGDFAIEYIGACRRPSYTNIINMMNALCEAKLFIGPVSFCYHLASCFHASSVLFTGYMPPHKFSHFFNTTSIASGAQCTFRCEEMRSSCLSNCGAYNYNDEEVYNILKKEIRRV